ncbi:hypothetical protein ACFW2Y_26625 [Streptomyces sp. NPDC058877]|uniref:hypothetical protein n=1 Tax=unclassified Streptomyces TaxID=2593676 RepID=UPI00369C50E9
MFERTEWATGVGRSAGGSPQLPDLAAVDLRTLRVMDDAVVGAAVEKVLRHPEDLAVAWPEDALVG